MVKLFVENTNLHSPVAAVRWCVDKNTVNKLKELGVSNPYMLFVVARENDGEFKKVDHKVVPLDQAMEYLEFHSGGKHRIFGCLIWSNYYSKKRLTRRFGNDSYYLGIQLVDSEGNFHKPSNYTDSSLGYGSIDIVVPDGYFAKEPAAWERWWVNLWYESKPVNQCHFRRRRLLAYSIQPPVILIFVLFKSLVLLGQILLLFLCGIRETRYEAFLHPFTYSSLDWGCVPYKHSSVFLTDSSGNDRHPIFWLLMPTFQIVMLVLVALVKLALGYLGLNIGSVLLWLLAINVILVLIVFAVSMAGGLDNLILAETEEQRSAKRKLELERLYAEYQDMVCSGAALQPSISALPSQRRTFYLRFQEFKSKVCLPFAR